MIGVIIHEGSMEGGHYWAIGLRDGQYYSFNDAKVTPMKDVFHRSAYIIMYCSIDFCSKWYVLAVYVKK